MFYNFMQFAKAINKDMFQYISKQIFSQLKVNTCPTTSLDFKSTGENSVSSGGIF